MSLLNELVNATGADNLKNLGAQFGLDDALDLAKKFF